MKNVRSLLLSSLVLVTAAVASAQTTPADPVADAETKIESVGTIGAKAYGIAAGLALTGVIIGFIRKAKK